MSWLEKKDKTDSKSADSTRAVGQVVQLLPEEVIISPRVTEKATVKSGDNVYTFNVHQQANKRQVIQAVEKIYNVHPVKVRVVNIPGKPVMRRRIPGRKARGRKAYVYLKKGDSIEFI